MAGDDSTLPRRPAPLCMTLATPAGNTAAPAGAVPARRPRSQAESARYSVLRRLAPALKHDMVVHLQAISMLADVLSARLDKGALAPADVETALVRMNRMAREAVNTCLRVAGWINPPEDETIRLRDGVDEGVALLRSGFSFRSLSLAVEVPDLDFEVSRVALRFLVPASLLVLADGLRGPGELSVHADVAAGVAVLSIRAAPRPPDDGSPPDAAQLPAAERSLDWQDVAALAAAEQVELLRTDSQVVLRLPRMLPAGPVQIAPV